MTVPGVERREVTSGELVEQAGALLRQGMRAGLVAAHQDPDGLRAVYVFLAGPPSRRVELTVRVPLHAPHLPSLAGLCFPLGRFEREMHDLYGIIPDGHPQPHRLVRHQHWPAGWYPMRSDQLVPPSFPDGGRPFPFTPVEGDGVYEIPVGPVHAGLIEPGHFRFSVVGERILRAKARLWFVHKGVEKLFEGRPVERGTALAEVISGDTAVGHATAYAVAVEEALGLQLPQQALLLRAALLELERLHNHVADLGALCNDVGHGVLATQAAGLRERLLRHNERVTGSRLLRGAVTVGGARVLAAPDLTLLRGVGEEIAELAGLALDNTVVRDRFTGTGRLDPRVARDLGVLGYVARGCGLARDARVEHPAVDLSAGLRPVSRTEGDVLARFLVRVEECAASLLLLERLAAGAAGGSAPPAAPQGASPASGVGVVEGWRGTIVHRVEVRAGVLTRVKVVDPSFVNWPALPLALSATIVPDFPLTNKSFNLSYAGNDL